MPATVSAKRHAQKVAAQLAVDYANAECALNFRSPLELLIATILSAQCTDVRVNIVTADLFKKYHGAEEYAAARPAELERDIQSTGFYRNKAKNIQACCRQLVEKHDGQVPKALEELVVLAGVGRKTANVVLGTAYQIASGVVVDTHVSRLSNRLGLTQHRADAVKIERDLMELLPRDRWIDFSHQMIHHGRTICVARKPKCGECSLKKICPQVGVD